MSRWEKTFSISRKYFPLSAAANPDFRGLSAARTDITVFTLSVRHNHSKDFEQG